MGPDSNPSLGRDFAISRGFLPRFPPAFGKLSRVRLLLFFLLGASVLWATPPLNPWEVLGVKKGDDYATVRKAFGKLSRQFHPDLAPPGQEEAQIAEFKKVQEAFEILTNPEANLRTMGLSWEPVSPGQARDPLRYPPAQPDFDRAAVLRAMRADRQQGMDLQAILYKYIPVAKVLGEAEVGVRLDREQLAHYQAFAEFIALELPPLLQKHPTAAQAVQIIEPVLKAELYAGKLHLSHVYDEVWEYARDHAASQEELLDYFSRWESQHRRFTDQRKPVTGAHLYEFREWSKSCERFGASLTQAWIDHHFSHPFPEHSRLSTHDTFLRFLPPQERVAMLKQVWSRLKKLTDPNPHYLQERLDEIEKAATQIFSEYPELAESETQGAKSTWWKSFLSDQAACTYRFGQMAKKARPRPKPPEDQGGIILRPGD